MDIVNM